MPGWWYLSECLLFFKSAGICFCALSHSERVGVIFYQKSDISWRMKLLRCFHLFPPTSHPSFSKTALTTVFTTLGLMGGAAHHVLVWAKSTILQQINCKTNRNIILNLESWQGKKWEQYESPVPWSSLKSLSSTHDKADCDCGTDRLWTITSDVFMDFQCDPIWNIAAVSAKNALYGPALPEPTLVHSLIWEPQSMLSNGTESKRICL